MMLVGGVDLGGVNGRSWGTCNKNTLYEIFKELNI